MRSRRFAYLLSIAWMIQNACFVAVVQASLKLSSIKVSAVCTSFLNGRRYESHESYEGDEGDEGHPVCALYISLYHFVVSIICLYMSL